MTSSSCFADAQFYKADNIKLAFCIVKALRISTCLLFIRTVDISKNDFIVVDPLALFNSTANWMVLLLVIFFSTHRKKKPLGIAFQFSKTHVLFSQDRCRCLKKKLSKTAKTGAKAATKQCAWMALRQDSLTTRSKMNGGRALLPIHPAKPPPVAAKFGNSLHVNNNDPSVNSVWYVLELPLNYIWTGLYL